MRATLRLRHLLSKLFDLFKLVYSIVYGLECWYEKVGTQGGVIGPVVEVPA